MTLLIGLLLALAAMVGGPAEGPAFWGHVLLHCTPVVDATFIGCTDLRHPEDDAPYAGLLWVAGEPSLETGP